MHLTGLLFSMTLALFLGLGVTSPNSTNCDCDPARCPSVRCACGIFKDNCLCCDICIICPGEDCNPYKGDERCTEGYYCDPTLKICEKNEGEEQGQRFPSILSKFLRALQSTKARYGGGDRYFY